MTIHYPLLLTAYLVQKLALGSAAAKINLQEKGWLAVVVFFPLVGATSRCKRDWGNAIPPFCSTSPSPLKRDGGYPVGTRAGGGVHAFTDMHHLQGTADPLCK